MLKARLRTETFDYFYAESIARSFLIIRFIELEENNE